MQEQSYLFTTPAESIATQDIARESEYIDKLFKTPETIFTMLSSANTGAYIRGLIKSHQLPGKAASVIAFAVFQTCVGETQLSNLGSLLSTKLQLSNEKAQQIAKEIERDLLAPITLDLNKHLQSIKQTPSNVFRGASNVLDLKKDKPATPSEQIF